MDIVFLIINIVIALGAIGALCIAIKSLKETQKTRRDSFMPLVIPRGLGWDGQSIAQGGRINIENCGRGPAWDISLHYPNGQEHKLVSFLHNEKYNQKECNLPWPDFEKSESMLFLEIIYHDVFRNKLKLRFPVRISSEGNYKILNYDQKDGFELILPK